MRRNSHACLRAGLLLLCVSLPSYSLSPANQGQQANETYTLRQSIDEVVLNCAVIDKKKQLVTNLEQKDFSVEEGGVMRTIFAFKHEDVPVSIGLLLDNSGSMKNKERAVATAFLDLLKASNAMDEAFVVYFSEDASLQQDFTSDIPSIRRTLDAAHRSFGGTAFYDALNLSASHMARSARHSKQIVIVITDGHDNASKSDLQQTIRMIQNLNGPIVYTIGLLYDTPSSEAHQSKGILQMLADETGGIAFFPKNLPEINAIAAEVAQDIRNQYLIAYRPASDARSSEYRSIHVTATNRQLGKLTVRTRKGYLFSRSPKGH